MIVDETNSVKKPDVSLWHLRLVHMSQRGIKQLVQGFIQETAV